MYYQLYTSKRVHKDELIAPLIGDNPKAVGIPVAAFSGLFRAIGGHQVD